MCAPRLRIIGRRTHSVRRQGLHGDLHIERFCSAAKHASEWQLTKHPCILSVDIIQ